MQPRLLTIRLPALPPQFLVRYDRMAIQYVWVVSTSTVPRKEAESRIRQDLENHPDLHPCHPGIITGQVLSSDPLEVKIAGQLGCTCGESFAQFVGFSEGSTLTYYESSIRRNEATWYCDWLRWRKHAARNVGGCSSVRLLHPSAGASSSRCCRPSANRS